MREILDIQYKIAKLISKKIIGNISLKEEDELLKWINKSQENQLKYQKWIDRVRTDLENSDETDALIEYNKIKRIINPSFFHRNKIALRVCSIAASIIIVFFVIQSLFQFDNLSGNDKDIIPGMKKAILFTDNGSIINIFPDSNIKELSQEGVKNYCSGILDYRHATKNIHYVKSNTHTIVCPTGGEYTLLLSDNSKIYLNSETKFTYPICFDKKDSLRMTSIKGEAFFEISHNANNPFIVKTHNGTIRVLGTKFNIHNYEDEMLSTITLVEGIIIYNYKDKSIKLNPGEQIRINKQTDEIEVAEVDSKEVISWVNGDFEFNNMPLNQIMKQLKRWYDINYVFKHEKLQEKCFTGHIQRNTSIENLLEQIEKTTNIHFYIKDKTIIVTN